MPFANEHAARLLDPKRFDKFRRKAGGKIFGRLEVPKTISVIWGHIKDGPPEAWAAQALRFPTKDWTESAAKKWLKDNKIKTIMFEAAKKKSNNKILAVHKNLHNLWNMGNNELDWLGVSRSRVESAHSEIANVMEARDLAHASIMIGHKIEKAEEFNFDDMVEHISNEVTGELEPIVSDNDIIDFEKYIPICKIDKEERMVHGIVLEPNTVDAQGDIVSEEEIRKACHKFMEFYQKIGYQHKNFSKKFRIMECYIVPVEFTLNGQTIRKGTWLLATRIVDDNTWKEIKDGKITGYSIGGKGKRIRRKV